MDKKLLRILLILFCLFPAAASAESRAGVAVWSIRAGSGISAQQAARLEQDITRALKAGDKFSVVSIERRNDLISEPGAPDGNCVSDECLSQAGRLLSVNWLIMGDVGKSGSNYLLNLLLVEASTGKVVGAFSKTVPPAGLVNAVVVGAMALVAQAPSVASTEPTIETAGPSGTVIIHSKPNGARAYIDAYMVGRTPTVAYRVPAGEHSVTLVLDGHDTVQTSVTVKDGQIAEINEILLMRTGGIDLDTDPTGASIYLDGRAAGKSPQKMEGLLVGSHRIRLEMDGYQPLETSITIEENQTPKRLFPMKHKGAMVLVTTQPEGAMVIVDGRQIGSSLFLGSLEPGKHTLIVQLAGYKRQTKEIEIQSGARSYAYHFRLARGADSQEALTQSPPAAHPPAARPATPYSNNPEAQKLYDQASDSENIEQRISLYKQAIALDPNFAEAHNDLGVDYTDLERWDDAIREYRAALTINPKYTFAHNNLGHAYLNTGRIDEAIVELKAALSLNPDYPTAHYNLGKAYFELKRYNDALGEFEKATKLDSQNAGAYFNLGRTLKRLNRLDDAIQAYLRCLEVDPGYVDVFYNLGDLYDIKGDKEAAIYYYQKYIEEETRSSEQEWVEKAKSRIKALRAEQ